MANTYTQLNVHLVFAVSERACIISRELGDELHSYITGILKNHGCYPLAVNGYRDHVHLFFELNPVKSVSEIAKEVKRCSSHWINENRRIPAHFRWQEGYAAFSYARSQRDVVVRYIMNQEEHHKSQSFRDEYMDTMRKFEIECDERYVFKWIGDEALVQKSPFP
ncbi:MAG: IS200/IS605 family transposase [Thermoguttaceae bacterium]